MRSMIRLVLVFLLVGAALSLPLALAHAHDGGTGGFYNAQCPACELARQSTGVALSSPDSPSLELAPIAVSAVTHQGAAEDRPAISSPRAPPLA